MCIVFPVFDAKQLQVIRRIFFFLLLGGGGGGVVLGEGLMGGWGRCCILLAITDMRERGNIEVIMGFFPEISGIRRKS